MDEKMTKILKTAGIILGCTGGAAAGSIVFTKMAGRGDLSRGYAW
jgi:hypothetical protein